MARIRNDAWKLDSSVKDFLEEMVVERRVPRKQVVMVAKGAFPQYTWSVRSLATRLAHFKIKYIVDETEHHNDIDQEEEEDEEGRVRKHSVGEATKRVHPCSECKNVFSKHAHLLRHQLIHNDQRPHVCTICKKGYRTAFHLNRHMPTHSGEKKFRCTFEGCEVACITEWNLKRHVKRTHRGLFKCETCGAEFKKNKSLQQHLSAEHKNNTICCDFPGCAQIFNVPAKMRHHMKIHNERGYLCPVVDCHEKFSLWSECRMHTAKCKMREVSCDVCGKIFAERSNMKAHRKVHAEEREVFTCTYEGCGRFYTKKHNLKAHVQSFHLNNRPHVCPRKGCTKSFYFAHKLRNHIDTMHSSTDSSSSSTPSSTSPPPPNEKRKKRPARRVNMSKISALTGHIPELEKKMTHEDINCYVDGDASMSDDESSCDTTQNEMSPVDFSDGNPVEENLSNSCSSGDVAAVSDGSRGNAPTHSAMVDEDEYETITELIQISQYVYKPIQRLVRRRQYRPVGAHTISSPVAGPSHMQYTARYSGAARKVSESSVVEQDECMIINSVDLPLKIRTEQDECMVAFNNRFQHMPISLSGDVNFPNVSSTCHLQSVNESESSDSEKKSQKAHVQCVA